ncbi:MAG: DapH/DapD/GlmU-related protein, partial [Solirubrobacteraceae bacterium]
MRASARLWGGRSLGSQSGRQIARPAQQCPHPDGFAAPSLTLSPVCGRRVQAYDDGSGQHTGPNLLRDWMDDSQWIATRTPEFRAFHDRVKVATRLSSKLSEYHMDEAEVIQKVFEELIGKEVGDTFNLIPPFYADYGLNITVGRAVFIGHECAFTGHAAIDIADEVMIAHKVNLITAGHPVEPDKRKAYITAEPITIATNVWIGAAATILPGVSIGADAVVAAGAVVTHDVPPATLVAGVPATVIRRL